MDTAIIISVLSLTVAGLTLFFTQLRPPKLSVHIGPSLKVYYADYSSGCSFGLYIPVTFLNTSVRVGSIIRSAITLHRKDSVSQQYFMQWKAFSTFNPELNKWKWNEVAHALAIPGKSSINKTVWFMWESGSDPKLFLREGSYILTFYYWDSKYKGPKFKTHEIFVDNKIFTMLEDYRKNEKFTTIDITLDKELDRNRVMSAHEKKRLLGNY